MYDRDKPETEGAVNTSVDRCVFGQAWDDIENWLSKARWILLMSMLRKDRGFDGSSLKLRDIPPTGDSSEQRHTSAR